MFLSQMEAAVHREGQQEQPNERRGERKTIVHMIGNAHIDHAWLWRWTEAKDEVFSTCQSALDRMREYPDFVFTFSSAVSYEWIEAERPEMFAEIRQRIGEGRWSVVGGWYVQPDCNIPSGESFVRQALYGKRYFQEKLGVDVKVGYNVDSFGHAGTLPQLLAGAGLDYYVFFRPGPTEKALPVAFWWQAPDGSRVLASRPPYHYLTRDEDLQARIAGAAEQAPAGLGEVMCFYGVGNHGGGPTIRNIESILAAQRELPEVETRFGTPDAFFASAGRSNAQLPTVAEELQHHARGCYSVLSEIKRANRRAEHSLMTAERLASLARSFGRVYPKDELTIAWKLALFDQFHDTLAGTCIPEVYDDTGEDYRRIETATSSIVEGSLATIAARADTRGEDQAVLLFNPLTWRRSGPVALAVESTIDQQRLLGRMRRPGGVSLRDARGEAVPAQITAVEHHGAGYRVRFAFDADLPGLGYQVYRLALLPGGEVVGAGSPTHAEASPTVLENGHLKVVVDPATGWITSLFDKAVGAEALSGPAAVPIVIDDPSDTWSHGVPSFRDEIGRFASSGDVRVAERGPVRSVVRARMEWGRSTVEQDFILGADARQLEVRVRVDWHEQWRTLKLAFPLAVEQARATYEAPYGHTVRPTNGEEEPGQQWVDVSGLTAGERPLPAGVSLLNDSKYGFDVLGAPPADDPIQGRQVGRGTELRMTALRSPAYAFHDPRKVEPDVTYEFVDQGKQEFRYALVPHSGTWAEAEVPRRAWELNVPVLSRLERSHAGDQGTRWGFLEVEPATVIATALKEAEDGGGIVVRLLETAGQPVEALLKLAGYTLDEPIVVSLRASEVKTLLIADVGPARADVVTARERVTEVDLLERREPNPRP